MRRLGDAQSWLGYVPYKKCATSPSIIPPSTNPTKVEREGDPFSQLAVLPPPSLSLKTDIRFGSLATTDAALSYKLLKALLHILLYRTEI